MFFLGVKSWTQNPFYLRLYVYQKNIIQTRILSRRSIQMIVYTRFTIIICIGILVNWWLVKTYSFAGRTRLFNNVVELKLGLIFFYKLNYTSCNANNIDVNEIYRYFNSVHYYLYNRSIFIKNNIINYMYINEKNNS